MMVDCLLDMTEVDGMLTLYASNLDGQMAEAFLYGRCLPRETWILWRFGPVIPHAVHPVKFRNQVLGTDFANIVDLVVRW
jgi:hypothetical protein